MMKKRKYLIAPLLLAGIVLIVYSCTKEDEVLEPDKQSNNSLVYEDNSLLDEVSPYFYDNHFYRIEKLGENPEKNHVVSAVRDQGFDVDCMILSEVQKFYFNHTTTIMYSIPTSDPEQTAIIYESNGLYQVTMATYRSVDGKRMQFALRTADDQLFYQLQIDEQNRMGELIIIDNKVINSFNNEIYSLTLETGHQKSLKGEDAECCRREATWKACMNCTMDACEASWFCRLSAFVVGPELAAAFAASCIGAGPDTFC